MHEQDLRPQTNQGETDNESVQTQETVTLGLDQCRQEMAQWKERCMRMTADFEN